MASKSLIYNWFVHCFSTVHTLPGITAYTLIYDGLVADICLGLKDKEIFTNHFDLHHGSVFLEQLPSCTYVSAVARAHYS